MPWQLLEAVHVAPTPLLDGPTAGAHPAIDKAMAARIARPRMTEAELPLEVRVCRMEGECRDARARFT